VASATPGTGGDESVTLRLGYFPIGPNPAINAFAANRQLADSCGVIAVMIVIL
jgi:hypothetical protein